MNHNLLFGLLGTESLRILSSLEQPDRLRLAKAVWLHKASYILPRRQKETQQKK